MLDWNINPFLLLVPTKNYSLCKTWPRNPAEVRSIDYMMLVTLIYLRNDAIKSKTPLDASKESVKLPRA